MLAWRMTTLTPISLDQPLRLGRKTSQQILVLSLEIRQQGEIFTYEDPSNGEISTYQDMLYLAMKEEISLKNVIQDSPSNPSASIVVQVDVNPYSPTTSLVKNMDKTQRTVSCRK